MLSSTSLLIKRHKSEMLLFFLITVTLVILFNVKEVL